jgi:hypothetical protein
LVWVFCSEKIPAPLGFELCVMWAHNLLEFYL